MTPLQLKEQLLTILDGILGTYTTEQGRSYPAIWISPPLIDPSWKAQGIAVNINKSPDIVEVAPLTSNKLKKRWWDIELIQYDTNESIRPALEAIENNYPVLTVTNKPQKVDQYEKAFISIYDPMFGTNEASLAPIFIPGDNEPDLVTSVLSAESDVVIRIGQPIYLKNNFHADLAGANNLPFANIIGFAIKATNPTFSAEYITDGLLTLSDWINVSGTNLLVPGQTYFLSNIIGNITNIPPTSGYIVSVGKAVSQTQLDIEIQQPIRL
jgi:hypothetical protein